MNSGCSTAGMVCQSMPCRHSGDWRLEHSEQLSIRGRQTMHFRPRSDHHNSCSIWVGWSPGHPFRARKKKGVANGKENLMVVTDKRVLFLSRTWRFGRRTGGMEEAFSLEDLKHVTLLHGETHCGCKGLKQHGTLTLDFSTDGNVMSWQGQMASSTGVKVTGCTRKIKVNLDGAQKAYNYLQLALLQKRQNKAKAAH